jgi:alanyl-tRNA synthetase
VTDRLYYRDSFLYDFDGEVIEVVGPSSAEPRTGVVLDRTAFYPTSGGQVHDVGHLEADRAAKIVVTEVADLGDGRVVHFVETPAELQKGSRVHGVIDAGRRRDHMQQHSGQHVLSAAFVRLFQIPTVSFHMGEETCSIDLDAPAISQQQVVAAESLANEIVLENRQVNVRYVTREEAEKLGLRKLPPAERDELRLVEVADFDLCACGGTHVSGTGQIGSILLRKTEKVKQGWRVEFVCGIRAVQIARRDYSTLTEAAALYSAHIWDVPQQVKKSLDDARRTSKEREALLGGVADAMAAKLLSEVPEKSGRRLVKTSFSDKDMVFVKLLAQKVTKLGNNVVVLVGSEVPPASVVFATSPGMNLDMGALLKNTLAAVGGRGGGSKEFAQGGVPAGQNVTSLLEQAAQQLS